MRGLGFVPALGPLFAHSPAVFGREGLISETALRVNWPTRTYVGLPFTTLDREDGSCSARPDRQHHGRCMRRPARSTERRGKWFALPLHYLFGAIPVGVND